MRKTLFAVACLVGVLAMAQSMLGDILQLRNRDESAFPVATQRTGGLLYGTDAGRPYVSNGTTWVGVCTELTGCPSDGGGGGGGVTDLTGIAPIIVVSDGGNGYTISIAPTDIDAGISGVVGAIYINDVLSAGSTYGGQVVKRTTTFNNMSFRIRTSGTGGTTNANVLATDGTNNCNFAFACNSATGATSVVGTGTCAFPADALITYSITSIGDCSIGPDLQGVVIVTGTTDNVFAGGNGGGSGGNFVLKTGDTMTGQLAIQIPNAVTPALIIGSDAGLGYPPVEISQTAAGNLVLGPVGAAPGLVVAGTSGLTVNAGSIYATSGVVQSGALVAVPGFFVTAGPGINACPTVDGAIWYDAVYGFLRCEGAGIIRRLAPLNLDIAGSFPQVDPTLLTFPRPVFTSPYWPFWATGTASVECVVPGVSGGGSQATVEFSTLPASSTVTFTVACDCSSITPGASTSFAPLIFDGQVVALVTSSDCTTTPFINASFDGLSF